MKILLLVEDNQNDALLALRAFKLILPTCETVHCTSAEEALQYLETAAPLPELILIDLGLPPPGIDGLEFIKRLKGNERYAIIPLAIITGWASEIVKVAALNVGLNYIIKPIEVTGFAEEFKRLLKQLGIQYA